MASHGQNHGTQRAPNPGRDRGIHLDLSWLGERTYPQASGSDSSLFVKCSWAPGNYQRPTWHEAKTYKSEYSKSPPLEFDLEINNQRWEVDAYRVSIGFITGHSHNTKTLGSTCKWFAWETLTIQRDSVEVDTPWHLKRAFTVPTDKFLPTEHDNPKGKVTLVVSIARTGMEKDKAGGSKLSFRSSGSESSKRRMDKPENPLVQYIFKISFEELDGGIPQAPGSSSGSSFMARSNLSSSFMASPHPGRLETSAVATNPFQRSTSNRALTDVDRMSFEERGAEINRLRY
ncbi:hypothetical protein TWF481_009826 [Arthrobotrys musiformis]|uniref:C2 NT-type domain-containing protein n=1 Tax=Arthrobotrys musiformis TaxID=47236 RepID=A0AAV9W6W9_9PEZI